MKEECLTVLPCCNHLQQEEALWTELIDKYHSMKAEWVPDIVGRSVQTPLFLKSQLLSFLKPQEPIQCCCLRQRKHRASPNALLLH